MHRRRGQRIFPGAGDQRDTAHPASKIGYIVDIRPLRRTQHLERELRHPVAECAKLQVLEDHICDTAIGGHHARALDRLHLRVGRLILGPGIDPQRHVIARDFDTVGPDPADAGDLALAKRHRQIHRIGIFRHPRRRRRAFATTAGGARGFKEARRPDHLPRHPHPAPKLPDWRTFGRSGQPKAVDLPGLDGLRSRPQKPLVDGPPDGRADGPADNRA